MKRLSTMLAAGVALAGAQADAQIYDSCPAPQELKGIQTATNHGCEFPTSIEMTGTIEEMNSSVNTLLSAVTEYGECVTEEISNYRKPGRDATSSAPDEMACAHAAAEKQATDAIISYGRVCLQESDNRIRTFQTNKAALDCYPKEGASSQVPSITNISFPE